MVEEILTESIDGESMWNSDIDKEFNEVMEDLDSYNYIIENEEVSKQESYIKSITESIDSDDILSRYKLSLECCNSDNSNYINARLKSIDKYISEHEFDYSEAIPQIVPYFTPGEIEDIYQGEVPEIPQDLSYSKIISELMYKYNSTTDPQEREKLENTILSYGWNPSVEFNENNIRFARNKQLKWLKENAIKIIDLTSININESIITESSSKMRDIYNRMNLFPVYIISSFTNTAFGNVITRFTHSTYSHSGLALDSNLKNIFTFRFDINNKEQHGGFGIESVKEYLDHFKESRIVVMTLFVSKSIRDQLESLIKYFMDNIKATTYNFRNIINIVLNRSTDDNPKKLSMVCSQFVGTILSMVNIHVVSKSNNLVEPADLATIDKNPRVFKVFEGLAKDYKDSKVEKLIQSLLLQYDISRLKYEDLLEEMNTNFSIESIYSITENEEANNILESMRELITPRAIITERKLPFRFTHRGDLIINYAKSLELEYQEAHKILTSYNKDNIEGIKQELLVLFYINCTIEKKISKMKL